jgi:ribonucleoside-diphosphate reductase alpha chain
VGLKAVAIYRDGCKRTQPVSTTKGAATEAATRGQPDMRPAEAARPYRRRLPDERISLTHKFSVAGHEGYITVGLYEDNTPGEIFVTMAKKGSVVSGLMDSFATAVSLALQYGVPLKVLVDKFSHTRFEPSGFTNNPEIPIAKSITDYIFRWLAQKYLPAEERPMDGGASGDHEENGGLNGDNGSDARAWPASNIEAREKAVFSAQADAPPCHECGEIMQRNGACYVCRNCGATSGCS